MTRRYLTKILATFTVCSLFQGLLLLPAGAESAEAAATGTAGNTAPDERTTGEAGDSDTPLTMPGNGSGLKLSLPAANFIKQNDVLKGSVSADSSPSPLLSGFVQTLPQNTKVDMSLLCNLNSELSQKGDEVFLRISHDVKGGDGHVLVPGNWVAHGFVVDSVKPGRNGAPGHVEVKLDRLVSPDGQTEVPFECKLSTGDKKIVAVSKLIARDIGYGVAGAAAGSVLSVQMTGIPLAVSTHGISVGVGATVGMTLAMIGAFRKKGNIYSGYPGDELKLSTAEPIALPGFNPANLPSAAAPKKLEGLHVRIQDFHFEKDTFTGDKRANILVVKFGLANYTRHTLDKHNLQVVSSKGLRYGLSFTNARIPFQVGPGAEKNTTMSFSVDSRKDRYYLVFVDDKGDEFNRTPIN